MKWILILTLMASCHSRETPELLEDDDDVCISITLDRSLFDYMELSEEESRIVKDNHQRLLENWIEANIGEIMELLQE